MSDYEKSIVIPAYPLGHKWIAGIQISWTDLSIPSMALDARFQAGMTLLNKSGKVKLTTSALTGRLTTYIISMAYGCLGHAEIVKRNSETAIKLPMAEQFYPELIRSS